MVSSQRRRVELWAELNNEPCFFISEQHSWTKHTQLVSQVVATVFQIFHAEKFLENSLSIARRLLSCRSASFCLLRSFPCWSRIWFFEDPRLSIWRISSARLLPELRGRTRRFPPPTWGREQDEMLRFHDNLKKKKKKRFTEIFRK